MAKNAMPVSKAKNAYELLDEVIDLIAEEPLRLDQTDWRRKETDDDVNIWESFPACGTIGCVASWVDTLKSKRPTPVAEGFSTVVGVGGSARAILGLTSRQALELFNGDAAGERDGDGGIEGHARRGILHIRKFQKKHAKQLRAKKV